ncbi:MAG: hypothetical protein JWO84_34 [Parcubacteria group bacterium]|nr:hypothetical protein [Parcubacteria group bacterium]
MGVLVTVLIVAAGVGAVWAFSDKGTGLFGMGPASVATTTLPSVCTQEAKICPDGTAVGRTGPNCEFAACPTGTTPEKESTVAALNQRILSMDVHITPLEVLEDSRCPSDVQCIQAGTVRARVKLEGPGGTQIETMVLGSPVSFGNKHVTLMSVTPAKNSKTTITPSNYRFTFSVSYGMGGDVTTGTLSGTMAIGPVCPVENVNNPCKPTPEMYAAHQVAVYAANKTTLVKTLTPNAQGAFSASLPVGTYYVTMAQPQPKIGGATGVPATLVIKAGATTPLAISIDTGIR